MASFWSELCHHESAYNAPILSLPENNVFVTILSSLPKLQRTLKEMEFYPTFSVTREPNSLTDAGRRHEIPGSEKKDFVTAITICRVQAFSCDNSRAPLHTGLHTDDGFTEE